MIALALSQPEAWLGHLLFASLRTGAAVALMPGVGAMLLPIQVRTGLSLAVGLLVMQLTPAPPAQLLTASGLLAVAGELALGAAAGVAIAGLFAAASVAGELLSQAMGLGFATMLDPGGTTSPIVASLLGLLMWLVFTGLDGPPRLLGLIVESYRLVPPGSDPLRRAGEVAQFGGMALAAGLTIALPVGAVLALVNLLLAVIARSAPQLNLFAVGFALLLLAGLATLPIALPTMLAAMAAATARSFDALAAILGG